MGVMWGCYRPGRGGCFILYHLHSNSVHSQSAAREDGHLSQTWRQTDKDRDGPFRSLTVSSTSTWTNIRAQNVPGWWSAVWSVTSGRRVAAASVAEPAEAAEVAHTQRWHWSGGPHPSHSLLWKLTFWGHDSTNWQQPKRDRGFTLSQKLLSLLDLLQEELLHSFCILQIWELQQKWHSEWHVLSDLCSTN